MNLLEPGVFWSDIALGALAFGLGTWLLSRGGRRPHVLFVTLAMATWSGAFYHGFINTTEQLSGRFLWTFTLVALGMTAAVIVQIAFADAKAVRMVTSALVGVWALFVVFISNDFLWAMALQGVAVLILVSRYLLVGRHTRAGGWLAGFVGLDALAVLQQQNGITLGLPMSHNTLFHFIEMPAFVCLAIFFDRFGRFGRCTDE